MLCFFFRLISCSSLVICFLICVWGILVICSGRVMFCYMVLVDIRLKCWKIMLMCWCRVIRCWLL